MKILIINYRYFISGGPERYMFDLIDILEKQGHEIIPFSIKSSRNIKTPYEKYFAEPLGGQDEAYFDKMKKTPKMVLDVIGRLFYSFHVKQKLEKLIKDTNPDVAYILHHYNKLSPSVIDACKKYDLPIVMRLSDYFLVCPQAHMIDGNNNICEKCVTDGYTSCIKNKCIKQSTLGSSLKAFAMIFHRYVLKSYDKVDHFICTNDFMKSKMIQSKFNENKISVIPTFKRREPIQNSTDSEKQDKYILYFGRFSNEKAVDTLIYAYLKSGLFNKNIKLYLIGGKLEDLSLNLTKDEEIILNNYCEIVDFVNKDKIANYISDALFVVHPSRWYENMPNTILEAYSYNKTVITCNIGSLPYLVEDGVVGYLYDYEDINDLSSKMLKLVDEATKEAMEKNIPQYFEQYNELVHYKKLMKILGDKYE